MRGLCLVCAKTLRLGKMASNNSKSVENSVHDVKNNTQVPAKWPVVINAELKDSDISRLLHQKHKVRFSETTVPSTCIFPLSAVAFMIVPLEKATLEWPPKSGQIQLDHEFVDRVQKLIQIHRNSYMVVTSTLHGPHEMEVISAIQTRFVDSTLKLLPVHNDSECVRTMLTIAQATCKPTSTILKSRLDAILSQQSEEQIVLNILSQIGLNHHEQGCGTIASVATATREQLMDCSLDSQTVNKILSFFEKDDYVEG